MADDCSVYTGRCVADGFDIEAVCGVAVADAVADSAAADYTCSAGCAQMVLPWAAGCRIADIADADTLTEMTSLFQVCSMLVSPQ